MSVAVSTPPPPRQGRAFAFNDPEPWPDPVDGAVLLDEIVSLCDRYLVLPRGASTTLALWIVFTYVFDAARISPRLLITSPVKGCGKTTTLTLLASLVRRPLPTSNISASALFRTIEAKRPTVLIDEGDSISPEQGQALRNILNSGHTPAFAFTSRTVGDNYEPRQFSTWAPIAFARIGRPRGKDATITDRSIIVELQRKAAVDRVDHLRVDRIHAECLDLRRRLLRWANDNLTTVKALDPQPPFDNRAGDNWRPLLAIADAIGGSWPRRARAAAATLSGAEDPAGDGDVAIDLLLAIKRVFADQGDPDRLSTATILAALNADDEHRWADWNDGAGIYDRDLADRLRSFRIKPTGMRVDGGPSVRGYYRDAFLDAWKRYRIERSSTVVAAVAPPAVAPATRFEPIKPASFSAVAAVAAKSGGAALRVIPNATPSRTATAVPLTPANTPTFDLRRARWARATGRS